MVKKAQNILVVLPNPLGDAILAGPALRRLRQHFPDSRITFLAQERVGEIWGGTPWADEILAYDPHNTTERDLPATAKWLRTYKFDGAVLLPNSFRSALLVRRARIKRRIGYGRDGRSGLLNLAVPVCRWGHRYAPIPMLDYYGFLIDQAIGKLGGERRDCHLDGDNKLALFSTDQDKQEIDALLGHWRLSPEDRLIVMVPGGAYGPSKWWPADRYGQLADRLSGAVYKVILLCAPQEQERRIASEITDMARHRVYNLVNEQISLGGVKELVRRAALMVGNDTGPCHVAAAFNVPLVTLFGPTDPRWTVTGYPGEIRLRVDVDCGPCQQPVCATDHRCLERISVEEVFAAVQRQLVTRGQPDETLAGAAGLAGRNYSLYEESFVPMRDGQGLVHSEYRRLLEQAGMSTLAEVFAYDQGRQLKKPGLGHRQRWRIVLGNDDGAASVFYLKRYGAPQLKDCWKRWIFRRRSLPAALYDFSAAMELAEARVPVARPVAYGCQSGWLGEKRSFVMFEALPHGEALERLLPAAPEVQNGYMLLRDKKKLIRQAAQLVQRLHAAGFCHRDLYLSHLFLGRDNRRREQLYLIDLHRVFKPATRIKRWRIKDLAQLYYSARPYCNKTDVIRFLHHYLDCKRLDPQHRSLAKAIRRKCEKIAQHDRKKQARDRGETA